MRLFKLSFLLSTFILTQNIIGKSSTNIPPERPKLVIGIVVDNMRHDMIHKYWNKFGDGGFKKLITNGTSCKNTKINYLFTQSSPGYAAIYSGTNSNMNGIISDSWYHRLKKSKVSSTFDDNFRTVGSESSEGNASAEKLLSTTFCDELKLSDPKSKVISISMKQTASVFAAGHNGDAAYWLDDISGHWISSSYYINKLPKWVKDFNNKEFAKLYIDRLWTPLKPSTDTTFGYSKGFSKSLNKFPYKLQQVEKATNGSSYLKFTPFGNIITTDFALSAIINEKLGEDKSTDVISIGYSVTDFVSNHFDITSKELEDIYIRLDKSIERLLNFIDESVGTESTLVFLVSDRGLAHSQKQLQQNKIPSGIFRGKIASQMLNTYLSALYGEGKWVSNYDAQQFYLNHLLIDKSKFSLSEIQDKSAQLLIQFSGIANATPANVLQSNNFTDGLLRKIQNSYHQKISGDVIINLLPGWQEEIFDKTYNNSIYNYTTHVPLVWYGWKINRGKILRKTDIIDIAPTISTFLNISLPSASTGKIINELVE